MRQQLLSWADVDKLVDYLVPQFNEEFSSMVMITRGGLIPGGLLANALGISAIFNVVIQFSDMIDSSLVNDSQRLLAWPNFIQFPDNSVVGGQKVLIVDNVWGSGRTITAVKNRVTSAGGSPYTCVFHFNPYRNLFGSVRPDYFAATTDTYIVYPWEVDRGPNPSRLISHNPA